MNAVTPTRPKLKIRRVDLDTGRENVAVISRRSRALRPEVFRGFSRVELRTDSKELLATLLLTDDDLLVGPDELGLADPAFRRFGEPAGSYVTVNPAQQPNSLDAVRAKIQGHSLSDADIHAIIDDVAHYRYSDMEIAAFLISSASFMTSSELLALAQAMAQAGTQIKWDKPVIVDKHCIGGIPGNRTSMIVVPIVAAHGLTIPKTSSRAITSPAGTADTMEVLARVDLKVDEMKEVVAACHGCLIWGGHVNLSPADDVLISVERPLSIDTREQMVASIMSKKIAAGSTHLLIDLPVGPAAKVTTTMEALRLKKLFEFVGDHFGISIEVVMTDGRQPIGNGIGPVLEAHDVMAVLSNDGDAPRDLREKSLRLAAHLLEYDPELRGGTGYARARELLDNGAALRQMEKLIDAQGPSTCRTDLGDLTTDIAASADGIVSSINCLRLNRLARIAGAPIDKGAGIKVFKKIGDRVERGEPLYRIHSFDHAEHDLAVGAARSENGYVIQDAMSEPDGPQA
ncbi:thymidine phosphorylase [Ancylobacter novellus DSM 506]|uniref:Putative thymidine phosphorylase n=1 Tax=Ancylobacter novellus (strain ATCC 8093 / DSM 506 / JCM 20403 / CCM 1077 / IAM 12100 / NBRC 12443 / NCIMB 10456) TaxID=639283 RepID=D7A7Q8_ANCN5|nr:thymidine phosphorylase family protein [Ancylobacter novellus]ADH88506.1 thymidine phosphorylase [Ancylobacter novellus DSM 506]